MKNIPLSLFVGATLLAGVVGSSWAMPITMQLNVNVLQICDDAGNNCASTGPAGNSYFEAETDKIWAQAGIDVNFIFGGAINNTAWLNGTSGIDFFTAGPTAGPGTTMYLANTLEPFLYGNAWLNGGGLAINMDLVTSFNGGIGRLDTIAHELGHNLNLDVGPGSFGGHSVIADRLMASGGIRNIPTSLAQICPDGPCYDLLPQDQIDIARRSSLLIAYTPPGQVPEPGTLALVTLALFRLAHVARRKRR